MTPFPHVVCASGMHLGVPAGDVVAAARASLRRSLAEIEASFRSASGCSPCRTLRFDDVMEAEPAAAVTEIAPAGFSAGRGTW
ncbi:hypothetical protein HTY61_09910 [Oricola thermophila]|uniref:Uncharacterized protein n=1 Tax=Oricola thermophila TaxID=2742145 RepID=A0A6N1VCG0_9HYPH|nr:hypothetical protein HTY61_09910 [Oricola thermophila]